MRPDTFPPLFRITETNSERWVWIQLTPSIIISVILYFPFKNVTLQIILIGFDPFRLIWELTNAEFFLLVVPLTCNLAFVYPLKRLLYVATTNLSNRLRYLARSGSETRRQ